MPDEAREIDIALHERNKKSGLNEMYIYNNNGFLELDENLINLDIVNFKITKCLYQYNVLQNEYKRYNFNVEKGVWKPYTDELISNSKAKISFKELFDEYTILREERGNQFIFGNENDRIALIE